MTRESGQGGAARGLGVALARLGAVVLVGGVLSLGVGGCATESGPPAWSRGEPALVWPDPPERSRIRYLGQIRSSADIGRRPGLMERLAALVFGRRDPPLVKPVAVARNARGMLVVADPSIPTVHYFDLVEREHDWLRDDRASVLRSPVGVAIDDAGRSYVADSVVGKVFVFDAERRLAGELGAGVLARPTGLALGPGQQELYVIDTLACEIVVFDVAGPELRRFGGRGVAPGQFNFPTAIAVAADGTMRISDSLNFRVQVLRADGTPVATFGSPGDAGGNFARPRGLASDRDGRIYVVDAGFENVQIFDVRGALLLAFGQPGTEPGEFTLPTGIFLDATDTLWVADSFNGRVQAFQLVGEER